MVSIEERSPLDETLREGARQDRILPAAHAQSLPPNVKTQILPGSGHMVQMEAPPRSTAWSSASGKGARGRQLGVEPDVPTINLAVSKNSIGSQVVVSQRVASDAPGGGKRSSSERSKLLVSRAGDLRRNSLLKTSQKYWKRGIRLTQVAPIFCGLGIFLGFVTGRTIIL